MIGCPLPPPPQGVVQSANATLPLCHRTRGRRGVDRNRDRSPDLWPDDDLREPGHWLAFVAAGFKP